MFENNAKGWYGSYSIIGRNLVQRFALILKKDEIISGNLKKAFYGDYFTTEENQLDEEVDNKKNKIDIFSEEYDKLKEEKLKKENEEKMVKNANLCTHLCLAEKERYKFHQQHHKELDRNLRLIKRKDLKNLVSYHPRMDFIWKRTITGPKWKLLKGRNSIHINNNKVKDSEKIKEKIKNNINQPNNFLVKYNFKSIPMYKQTRRGSLPITYDSRIRTDVPFMPKNIVIDEKGNNKFSNNKKKFNQNKFAKTMDKIEPLNTLSNSSKKYLKTYNNFHNGHSLNSETPKKRYNTSYTKSSIFSHTLKLKKNNSSNKKNPLIKILDKDTFNRTIDFSKTLPRNLNVFVQKKIDETTPPFSTPSYKLTEPRCISMVSYNNSVRDKIIPKKFMGIDPELFIQPDKALEHANNHKKSSAPSFDIMSGRNQKDGPLPAYMINVWDRRSIETMTEKGLKMNYYSNSEFYNGNYSMFKPKKSYNKMINYTIMKNDNDKIDEELKNINEEVFGNEKLKKLIEKYSSDDKDNTNNQPYFDAISLKSFKRERKKQKNKFYPLNYQF